MAQYEVTLESSGEPKVVVLQEFTIKLKNLAIEATSVRTQHNGKGFDSLLQDEIVRQLLVSVDGRKIGGAEREDLDVLFSYGEYQELLMVMNDVMGGAAVKKPKIKIVTGNS